MAAMCDRRYSCEDEQSPEKKSCITCTGQHCSKSHCTIFSDFPESLRKGFLFAALNFIMYEGMTVTTLSIGNCNADEPYSFSEAFCSVARKEKRYLFASLFETGIRLLIDYTARKERKIPENKQERFILAKLLHFIHNSTEKGECDPLQNLDRLKDGTETTILLANHLFGKLSTSSDYLMNRQCKWKGENCPCSLPTCKLTGDFGDTSIGNGEVWHGNMDIIIKDELAIQTTKEDEESDSPGEKSPEEMKKGEKCLQKNPQIIATTILFSFFQQQRHPESSHYLIPCIGISSTEMVIYFYDSEHDVLLESSGINIGTAVKDTLAVNVVAVIVAWLVVNHKYLCSGLMDILKAEKAHFFSKVGSKLSVYQNQLKLGNVASVLHKYRKSTGSFPFIPDSVGNSLLKELERTNEG